MKDDLRLELRTRNNRLWHLIFDDGGTVASFCRQYGYDQGRVGAFLNLSQSPYSSRSVSPTATRIATDARMLVEDLFPRDLYSEPLPSRLVAEIPSHAYRGLTAARRLALPPAQENSLLRAEMESAIHAALDTVTPREAKVLRMRFGLGIDGEEYTCEETGRALGVTSGRARQIEARALRKLRHESRLRKLRPYIDIVHASVEQT